MLLCENALENDKPSSRGIVFITTLLFLFVITLLGLTIMEVCLMQTKMLHNFQQKNLIFLEAENNLRLAEKALVEGEQPTSRDPWSYEVWPPDSCQNKHCYKVTAIGQINNNQMTLHSIYVLDLPDHYRLAWWIGE